MKRVDLRKLRHGRLRRDIFPRPHHPRDDEPVDGRADLASFELRLHPCEIELGKVLVELGRTMVALPLPHTP